MKESKFKELVKESTINQWNTFNYYRNLCKEKGMTLEDLKKAIDNEEYYLIPGVASLAFKKSRNLIHELNDLSIPGKFQVSSSTSGDPSYIYTSQGELKKILQNYVATFGLKGVPKAIGFAPSIRILEELSRKANYLGKKSINRMKFALDAAKIHYTDLYFTVDVNIWKSAIYMAIHKRPYLEKMPLEEIVRILRESERKNEVVGVGGVVLLLDPYLDRMEEGQFNFHEKIHIVFSGGGYNGMKGAIQGRKINKPEFIKKAAAVFGLDEKFFSTNVKDIYGFTESPGTHEGYWNSDVGDFVFEPWHESKIYIVDPDTEKPLKKGKGLLKVIAPYANGRPSAANVSVVQYDLVTLLGVKENYQVTTFSNITRFHTASVEGCAFKAHAIANNSMDR